jgi:hypothetical protein
MDEIDGCERRRSAVPTLRLDFRCETDVQRLRQEPDRHRQWLDDIEARFRSDAGRTYLWKVLVEDGKGGNIENETWRFTTQ